MEDCSNTEHERGFFPDLTNNEFQEFAVNIAKRFIDVGADAIWIDGLYRQPMILMMVTNNPRHLAVKASFEGAREIVDRIRNYAEKKGRKIYIGTWVNAALFPFQPPKFDFLTFSPSRDEVLDMKFREEKWNKVKELVEKKFGEIPIFVYLDYGVTDNTPLAVFSQKLNSNEQKEFLRIIDEYASKKGMNFAYPVHGFYMGRNATKLSFGKYSVYDSLAPEFNTYETIKELAQRKAGGRK